MLTLDVADLDKAYEVIKSQYVAEPSTVGAVAWVHSASEEQADVLLVSVVGAEVENVVEKIEELLGRELGGSAVREDAEARVAEARMMQARGGDA